MFRLVEILLHISWLHQSIGCNLQTIVLVPMVLQQTLCNTFGSWCFLQSTKYCQQMAVVMQSVNSGSSFISTVASQRLANIARSIVTIVFPSIKNFEIALYYEVSHYSMREMKNILYIAWVVFNYKLE